MASIRKRKFGNKEAWVVDYYDQHGKRRLKTFPNKKSAEAWKTNALHEVQQGTHTPASVSRTVIDVGDFGWPIVKQTNLSLEPSCSGSNIFSIMYCRSLDDNDSQA